MSRVFVPSLGLVERELQSWRSAEALGLPRRATAPERKPQTSDRSPSTIATTAAQPHSRTASLDWTLCRQVPLHPQSFPPRLSSPAVLVDHYGQLGVDPSASLGTIRAAFHRLILQHHPDRIQSSTSKQPAWSRSEGGEDEAHLLNAAWAVLRQPETRRAYDEQRAKQTNGPKTSETAPSFALAVSLDLFTPHYNPTSTQTSLADEEDDPSHYTYPCRCSGTFTITTAQLEAGEELVQCDGCSERCRVEYEVLEDEEYGVDGVEEGASDGRDGES